MNVYRVRLEADGEKHTVTVPAKSKRDARDKAQQLYDDETVTVTAVDELEDNESGSESGTNGSSDTDAKNGDNDGGNGKKDGTEGKEDSSDSSEGKDTDTDDDADSTDKEPQDEHWFFKRRGKAA